MEQLAITEVSLRPVASVFISCASNMRFLLFGGMGVKPRSYQAAPSHQKEHEPFVAGDGEAKSVEGQVQQLLQAAQDPENLCRMYVGWGPFL